MIEVSPESEGNILVLRAVGKLTDKDYNEVLIPRLESIIQEHGKARLVLETRKDMFVIARTDATDIKDIIKRARAFSETGSDAILFDAIEDLELIKKLKSEVGQPLVFNQIAGGKSPMYSLNQLCDAGVSLVVYSTPCLFPVQAAIEEAMNSLKKNNGLLQDKNVGLKECSDLLNENLARRDRR